MFELSRKLALLSLAIILGGVFLTKEFGRQSVAGISSSLTNQTAQFNQTSIARSNGSVVSLASASDEPQTTAAAYGVYTTGGAKLESSSENRRWPIASLTKLMTALVARDVTLPNDKIEIKQIDPEVEGFAGNFSVGETYSERDLEKALLIVSSNVAGDAIADYYGRQRFVDTMNSYAYKIGMRNTYFADPTGLSYQNQSTVEDLDKLVTYIFNNKPDLFKFTREKTDTVYNYKSGKRRTLSNINQFAGRSDFLGGKTGTTPEAIGNLISIFIGAGKTPNKVIILLGTADRFNETNNILNSWNHK